MTMTETIIDKAETAPAPAPAPAPKTVTLAPKLPRAVELKLAELRQAMTDSQTLAQNMAAKVRTLSDTLADPRLTPETRDSIRAEVEIAEQIRDERVEQAHHIKSIHQLTKGFLNMVKPGTEIRAVPGPVPKAGSDPVRRVAVIRDEIAALKRARAEVGDSPLSREELVARAKEHVLARAAQGVPYGLHTVIPGEPRLRSDRGRSFKNEVEALFSFMCWFRQSDVVEKLTADIDAALEGKDTLTSVERNARLAELDVEILTAERDEEATICAALAQGHNVTRRRDADPRAVLGLEVGRPR